MLQVVIGVVVSKQELPQSSVKEAFDKYGSGFHQQEEEEEELRQVIEQQEIEILQLQKSMADYKKMMNERKKQ